MGTGNRERGTGKWEQGNGNRERGTGKWEQGNGEQGNGKWESQLPTPNSRIPNPQKNLIPN